VQPIILENDDVINHRKMLLNIFVSGTIYTQREEFLVEIKRNRVVYSLDPNISSLLHSLLKIRISKTNVPVILRGCETWSLTDITTSI
jgi:hypothetical protein